MNDLAILIVEDEPEVRDALIRDVAPFEGQFVIEAAEDVDDAHAALASLEFGLCLIELPLEIGDPFLDPGDDPVDLGPGRLFVLSDPPVHIRPDPRFGTIDLFAELPREGPGEF